MNEEKIEKDFDLRDVLTVTTGKLLTKKNNNGDGIEALCRLLKHMTNENVDHHQIPRFTAECKPFILKKYPELNSDTFKRKLDVLDISLKYTINPDELIENWLWILIGEGICKKTYSLGKIDNHKDIDMFVELDEMTSK